MSRDFWRLALICLLLAALPLSGFASASVPGCAPAQGAAVATQAHSPGAPVADHRHASAAHWMGHHGAVADAGSNPWLAQARDAAGQAHDAYQAGDSHGAHDGSGVHHGQHDGAQQCSSCAPCCVGMALFYSSPLPQADGAPLAEYPPAETRYRSAWLGTLDRPPRFFLA